MAIDFAADGFAFYFGAFEHEVDDLWATPT